MMDILYICVSYIKIMNKWNNHMQRLKFICIEDDIEFSEKLKQIVIQYFHYTNFLVTVSVHHDYTSIFGFR